MSGHTRRHMAAAVGGYMTSFDCMTGKRLRAARYRRRASRTTHVAAAGPADHDDDVRPPTMLHDVWRVVTQTEHLIPDATRATRCWLNNHNRTLPVCNIYAHSSQAADNECRSIQP